MKKKRTPKGVFYREDKVKKILRVGGKKLKSKKKNCWAVDLRTLIQAATGLALSGKKVMRVAVTKDVPGKSPGEVIDPTVHLLFMETVNGCMEEFPPVEYP